MSLHWLARKPCNYLLTDRDLGDFECATRSDCAGWFLYKSKAALTDCNPFRVPGR